MRRTTALLAALTLSLAACGGSGSEVVVSVGENEITMADIAELFEGDSAPIDDPLREAIFALAAYQVLVDGLTDDFGEEPDLSELDAEVATQVEQMEAAGVSPGEFVNVPGGSLEMLVLRTQIGIVSQQVIDQLVAKPEVADAFFATPASYTTVCARHVLVNTEAEADAVVERLEGGEPLADVAADVSTDLGSPGGSLGCNLASRFVAPFSEATLTAEIGEVTGPVETTFGFHVIVVDERSSPTEAEFRADPVAYLSENAVLAIWGDWLTGKLETADVDLDPRYGTWGARGIAPPVDEG